jgi:hypothetical protein
VGGWGFWGAGKTKPMTRSGGEEGAVKPDEVRTKSVRTSSTRDDNKSRSSGSDKVQNPPPLSRSKTARASTGLGGMFGVAPPQPSRSKSHRHSSKTMSRRPSIDQDAAMMSPPQTDTDAKVSSKAARVMGMKSSSRRTSTKDKGKTRGKHFPTRHDSRPIGRRNP